MADLQLTFSDLYNRVAKYLGTYGSSGPTGSALTDAKDIVNDAYTKFLTAYDWSFLKPVGQLTTMANEYIYTLPSDFCNLLSSISFAANEPYSSLDEVSVENLLSLKSTNDYSSIPDCYAIRPSQHNNETGQIWELMLNPIPDAAYTLLYRYKVMTSKLENAGDIPAGSAQYTQLLKQMAIAEAELSKDKVVGPQSQIAGGMLQGAITNDIKRNPHNLGYNGDGITIDAWSIARGSYRVNDVNFNTD